MGLIPAWAMKGLSLSLVLTLLQGFFSSLSGFPPCTKTNIPNSNLTKIEAMCEPAKAGVASSLNMVNVFFFLSSRIIF